eukprot:1415302-Rhodomonas_salina.2
MFFERTNTFDAGLHPSTPTPHLPAPDLHAHTLNPKLAIAMVASGAERTQTLTGVMLRLRAERVEMLRRAVCGAERMNTLMGLAPELRNEDDLYIIVRMLKQRGGWGVRTRGQTSSTCFVDLLRRLASSAWAKSPSRPSKLSVALHRPLSLHAPATERAPERERPHARAQARSVVERQGV